MRNIRIRIGVLILCQNKVLLIEHAKDGRSYWLIPGGGLNYGETIADCARRELKEETNLDINLIRFLFSSESIAPDGSRHIVNLFFLGTVVGNSFENLKLGDEERLKSVAFIDIDDLDKIEFHPPFGAQLKSMILSGFLDQRPSSQQHLGNLWKNYSIL